MLGFYNMAAYRERIAALPPGHRKFLFETRAADPVCGTAVIAEHLSNQSDEACGQEQQASGFGSPGAGDWAGCGRPMGWAENRGFSLSRVALFWGPPPARAPWLTPG